MRRIPRPLQLKPAAVPVAPEELAAAEAAVQRRVLATRRLSLVRPLQRLPVRRLAQPPA